QWEAQDSREETTRKQQYLWEKVRSKQITVNCHDCRTSMIEAILARGDRRLAPVLEQVAAMGGKLDAWSEHFSYDRWIDAMDACGVDGNFYSLRKRDFNELLPWDFIDIGVSKDYLIREAKRSYEAQTTPNCAEQCNGCGANKMMGGKCDV
ncbi:MAG: B12-binding domain-containing radical SAM protein, partial [Clostridia bacterium]|nr:B12-binding domain-containing radical SAM protein [Clostridia bacterium]